MNYAHPELRDRLAAEYALGTLRGRARRRFERLLSGDAGLRDLVQGWEMRVNLLAESAPAVPPPARVWEGIAQRIGPAPTPAPAAPGLIERLWDSLGFWRGAGLLAAGAAAALAVFIALRPPGVGPEQVAALDQRLAGIETKLAAVETTPREIGALGDRLARIEDATQGLAQTPSEIAAIGERLQHLESRLSVTAPPPSHIAVLLDKQSRPMMTADLDVKDGQLVLRLNIKPPRDFTDKALEVWMVPAGGAPQSLGLFPSERSGTTTVLVLPRDVVEALAAPDSALAVSLEPKGGSTTGGPTGPVLFSGGVVPVDL
jgi:anti-sigma-K factor RskA